VSATTRHSRRPYLKWVTVGKARLDDRLLGDVDLTGSRHRKRGRPHSALKLNI